MTYEFWRAFEGVIKLRWVRSIKYPLGKIFNPVFPKKFKDRGRRWYCNAIFFNRYFP